MYYQDNNTSIRHCQSYWLVLSLVVLLLISPFITQGSLVDDLDEQIAHQQAKQAELEKKAREYQAVISEKKSEIRSLNNDIAIYDAEISKLEIDIDITEERIHQTELEILRLEYGVEQAAEDIEKNKLVLAEVIRTINENDQTSEIEIILGSDNFSDIFSQMTYVENLQTQVQVSVDELQALREQLSQDKVSAEQKKEDLQNFKGDLTVKQGDLSYQKNSRQVLLNRSKGEESTYQKMLADIESQKRSLLGDINSLRQQKSEELSKLQRTQDQPPQQYWASLNWYYRQDDPIWGSFGIGRTNSSMANYGCAISSVAMVFTKLGVNMNPGQLAKEPIFYYDLIVWPEKWNHIQLNTKTFRTAADWAKIDREIGAGYPVIVRIQADGRDGGHYVVIHHKTDDGRYVVHDPLFGANIYLSSSRAYLGKIYGTTTSINQMIIYH